MSRVLFVILILFAASFGHAENSEQPPYYKVEKLNPGLRLVFSDGREAELWAQTSEVHRISVGLRMTESLCPHVEAFPSCSISVPFEILTHDFIWTKNPDPSRLFQPVRVEGNQTTTVLSNPLQVFLSIENRQASGQEQMAQSATMTCNDSSWLDAGLNSTRWNSIVTWSGESNVSNIETTVDENQATVGAFNLQLTKMFGSIFRIEDATHFMQTTGGLVLFGSGPVTMVTRDNNHELCQSSFMPDTGKAVRLVRKFLAQEPTGAFQKPTWIPAISLIFPLYDLEQVLSRKNLVFR